MSSNCRECNAKNVFNLYTDGDDDITIKIAEDNRGNESLVFMVRDGNYKFQEVWMDLREYEDVCMRMINLLPFIKERIYQVYEKPKEKHDEPK